MKIKAYVPIIGPHLLKNYILYPAYMPSPSQQVGPTTHLLWGRWHTCQIHDITSSFVLMITTIVEIEPRMMFLIFWRLLIFEKTVVNFLFYILYVGCTWQWHPLDSSTVHTHLSKLIYVLNKNHLVLVNIFHTVYQEKKNPYIHGFCWEHMTHHWIPTHTFVKAHLWACSKSFQK